MGDREAVFCEQFTQLGLFAVLVFWRHVAGGADKKINTNDVLIFQIIFFPCPSSLSKSFKPDKIVYSEIYINILLCIFLHEYIYSFFLIFIWNLSIIFIFSGIFSSEPELLYSSHEFSNSFSRLCTIFSSCTVCFTQEKCIDIYKIVIESIGLVLRAITANITAWKFSYFYY